MDVRNVSKCYHIYSRPQDRLLQLLLGRKRRFYKEFWALKDVNLTVRRGESVALLGRNGAGKSTLLQVISGVLQPTAGTASITGRIAPLLELGTSFNPEFSGMENIALSASVLGLTEEQIAERRDTIAAFADIGDFIHQPVRTYSSGMQARLAFAVAAHVDAEVLIVDEILSVGDIAFTQKCTRFIREFRERGTLLFVSHDMSAVTALCDRAVWLNGGQVIEDGAPRDVAHHYKVWMANPQKHLDARAFLESLKAGTADEAEAPEPEPAGDGAQPVPDDDGTLLVQDLKTRTRVSFHWDALSSGEGGARIERAWIEDAEGSTATMVNGGDAVTLWIEAEARQPLQSPIVGFGVKDRLGQVVFAWDTSKTDLLPPVVDAGQTFRAGFRFRFPYLTGGTYTINLALADGTPDTHIQHHWMYDAMEFQVQWSSVAQGLIGIPMEQVVFTVDA
ncbi:ABC transporter ATP-binding protein (plasmid) [Azospirillum brasilense]|nr:ABC transporter ATP-binding protein [Azospirillum brasilense]